MNEGVGKKIVEALKKQNDIEIVPVADDEQVVENYSSQEHYSENSSEDEMSSTDFDYAETFFDEANIEQPITQQPQNVQNFTAPVFEETPGTLNFSRQTVNLNQTQTRNSELNFAKDLDDFEVPNNISVLKQLILQLPTGVTKQTGALIIRQTMEALGISMKSVLQEAQQVQESINSSSRECQANIMECKRQIVLLENQVQKYTKQYAALNDIISLFIQTGN